MKLNFWQVLGVLLLLIGVAWFIYAEFIAADAVEELPANGTPAGVVAE